jgi:hypothetical protein
MEILALFPLNPMEQLMLVSILLSLVLEGVLIPLFILRLLFLMPMVAQAPQKLNIFMELLIQ